MLPLIHRQNIKSHRQSEYYSHTRDLLATLYLIAVNVGLCKKFSEYTHKNHFLGVIVMLFLRNTKAKKKVLGLRLI